MGTIRKTGLSVIGSSRSGTTSFKILDGHGRDAAVQIVGAKRVSASGREEAHRNQLRMLENSWRPLARRGLERLIICKDPSAEKPHSLKERPNRFICATGSGSLLDFQRAVDLVVLPAGCRSYDRGAQSLPPFKSDPSRDVGWI